MDKAGMGLPLTRADPGAPTWEMDGLQDTDPTLMSALLVLTGNRMNTTVYLKMKLITAVMNFCIKLPTQEVDDQMK